MTAEPAPADAQEQQPDRVVLSDLDLAEARAGSWQRRYLVEAERAELLEAGMRARAREYRTLQDEVEVLRRLVEDRDAEIRTLRGAPVEEPADRTADKDR